MADDGTSTRHVLGLSGGKDSAALAIYLSQQGRVPNVEYFFCDTGAELREVYEFLDRLEAYLGKPIRRLSSHKTFDHFLSKHNHFLPSPRQRWCTREMKIRPFEEFVGSDPVVSYIGIRADEMRGGYDSTLSGKVNIRPRFPFIEDGITKSDVFRILRESVGVPAYYQWRKRSGCFFCFFQTRREWLGLYRQHPDLFERAVRYEREAGAGYTWVQGMTLIELVDRAAENTEQGRIPGSLGDPGIRHGADRPWQEVLMDQSAESASDDEACLICSL